MCMCVYVCIATVCVCMCLCVATAVREDGIYVSVPAKMTHFWAGNCLLRACVCVDACA